MVKKIIRLLIKSQYHFDLVYDGSKNETKPISTLLIILLKRIEIIFNVPKVLYPSSYIELPRKYAGTQYPENFRDLLLFC